MNRASFDALYREHYHRIVGLCRRMLGGVGDGEDAAQEAFMRAYRSFGGYKTGAPFGPWISTIASNYCIDVLRRHRRLADVFSDIPADGNDLVSPLIDGVGVLISAHDADAITRAVEALPEKYRLPIVLAYYADASYDEIANTLDITTNHVGVLLLRGKQHLRDSLQNNRTDSGPIEEH